jgi:hypothetical protein
MKNAERCPILFNGHRCHKRCGHTGEHAYWLGHMLERMDAEDKQMLGCDPDGPLEA